MGPAHRGRPDVEFAWFPALPPPLSVEEPEPPPPLHDAFGPLATGFR